MYTKANVIFYHMCSYR